MTLDLPDLISIATWVRQPPMADRAFICAVCERRRVEDASFRRTYAVTERNTGWMCRDCAILDIGNRLETLTAIVQEMQNQGDDE